MFMGQQPFVRAVISLKVVPDFEIVFYRNFPAKYSPIEFIRGFFSPFCGAGGTKNLYIPRFEWSNNNRHLKRLAQAFRLLLLRSL
jgi:hypothetical protein